MEIVIIATVGTLLVGGILTVAVLVGLAAVPSRRN
jgi:hypothetical protein